MLKALWCACTSDPKSFCATWLDFPLDLNTTPHVYISRRRQLRVSEYRFYSLNVITVRIVKSLPNPDNDEFEANISLISL